MLRNVETPSGQPAAVLAMASSTPRGSILCSLECSELPGWQRDWGHCGCLTTRVIGAGGNNSGGGGDGDGVVCTHFHSWRSIWLGRSAGIHGGCGAASAMVLATEVVMGDDGVR